jgi:hypothetical protein
VTENKTAEMAASKTGETPKTEPVTETVTNSPVETKQVEEYDQARAMALIEKLRAENKEALKAQKRLAELENAAKVKAEAEMTEAQKLTKRLQEVEQELANRTLAEKRRNIADKVGLPATLASRITGATDEEMETDAKALLEFVKPPEKLKPPSGPTNPGQQGSSGPTDAEIRARVYGQSTNIFSPEEARKHGGGVIISGKNL